VARLPPPPLKFLLSHPAHFIACGAGSGLSPFASGTAGTLFAWITYPLLRMAFPTDMALMLALGLAFVLGVAACQITGRHLGVSDHGAIVWDEIVPFWTILAFAPVGLAWQLFAFLVFRFFDIVKPPPARFFDEKIHNGFGVMMDDLIAGGYTLLVLAIAKVLLERLF
jgi:phosphatidylglycerophosphatase A